MSDWDHANVVNLIAAEATVRVSRVVYRYDVLRPATLADAIPLGVFVDMRIEHTLYGLGLMARLTTAEHELSRVGPLAHDIVSKPFDYLSEEFDRLFGEEDAQRAFAALPDVHCSALSVLPSVSRSVPLPRHLRARPNEYEGFGAWAKDTLVGIMSKEFWELLDEHWPGGAYDREARDDVKIAA